MVFRTYFSKNNTLIKDNVTNNSQNPVTELFYGTEDSIFSRFIFDLDYSKLSNILNNLNISQDKIISHKIYISNSIATRPDLIGGKMQDTVTIRTGSFDLELYEINEDWDEGNGYDFIYNDKIINPVVESSSNWFTKKTDQNWLNEGSYPTGSTGTTIGTVSFDQGNENFEYDLTDYVNEILFSGKTTNGFGIKFPQNIENIKSFDRYSVGFFTKYTHTFFEPYIETIIDDVIIDNRKNFKLDNDNRLYLVDNKVTSVSSVSIIDNNGIELLTFSGDSIVKVMNGVYYIQLNLDSSTHIDSVLYKDSWQISKGIKNTTITKTFYLTLDNNGVSNFDFENFRLSYNGIKYNEIIKSGDKKEIIIDVKKLYDDIDSDFEIQYNLYTKQGAPFDIKVIDYTRTNYYNGKYYFILDTSWLIEGDYYIDLKIVKNGLYNIKETIKFRVQKDSRYFGFN